MNKSKTWMELWQENQDLKKKLERLKERIIDIEGWKGKDKLEITKEGAVYVIVEHRKDKETGEISETRNTIPRQNVRNLWEIIKKFCPYKGNKTKYREIVPKIIEFYGWDDVDVDSFNGGKNRNRVYFPFYYFPVKVIEYLGGIKYGGRGTIKRLK